MIILGYLAKPIWKSSSDNFFLSGIASWDSHDFQNFWEYKKFYRRGGKWSAEKLAGFEKCEGFLFLKGLVKPIEETDCFFCDFWLIVTT